MSARHEPHSSPKGAIPSIALTDEAILRERAHAPVESAIRSHFASLGGGADDATVRNATSIVLRGLTHSALTRIATAGIGSADVIQSLIPKPAQSSTLPAFNWSSITPAEIERLRSLGLLSERHHKMALGMRGDGEGREGDARTSSARLDGLSHSEAAYFSEMRSHALKHGLGWAADNRDILRLGPAAIETFARMKFDKESYHALTRDAGLSPEKAHGLVKAMEAAKVTPDEAKELAKRMGATGKGLSPEQQEQHRQLMENWLKSLKADPSAAPAELGKLHKWLDERKAADPGKASAVEDEKKAVKRIQDRLEEKRAQELRTNVKSDATEKKADDAVQAGNDRLAALLGKPTVAVTPAAPTGAPPSSPPVAAEPVKPAPPATPPTPVGAAPKP